MRVIFFVFGGRQPNLEVALPFYQRILDENPDVEFHLWDLARDPQDHEYMRSLPTMDRFLVNSVFYQGNGRATNGQNKVWRHYTQQGFQDCIFVKADDDVLFYETDQFASFVEAAQDNPDRVISALTINNGASTRLIPDIWAGFESLDIPLLDVHLSTEYAELSHRWFFQNWQTITDHSPILTPTEDWLSINCIAYTWATGKKISARIGSRAPRHIAGRDFDPYRSKVGDEGSVNILPRLIHQGFVAGHLNFGPQIKQMDAGLLDELRKLYADVARQYL